MTKPAADDSASFLKALKKGVKDVLAAKVTPVLGKARVA